MDARFKTPFNCIISGSSKTGKTTFVYNLLTVRNTIFTKNPDQVLLFFKHDQDIYKQMLDLNLVDELISIDEGFTFDNIVAKVNPYKDGNGSLLIIDDAMTDIGNDFEQVFTNLSHHQNCSVIFLTQNLFYKDKTYRTMSLNAHYFVIMKNPRDKQQISILAKQFCPGNSTYVINSYLDATKYSYSYLILDFMPDSPSSLRLRSKIFPHEFPYTVYLEK
jgi:hypothetical protein